MDEPESTGAIGVAVREKLDNLIFVVNCNLQRLDGPVRGNGKIIQELEGLFRGAGWNVIKCVWGSDWDPLLAKDTSGRLVQLMNECVDGEYQSFKAQGRGLRPQGVFRTLSGNRAAGRGHDRRARSAACIAAGTIRGRFTTPTKPPPSTRAARR